MIGKITVERNSKRAVHRAAVFGRDEGAHSGAEKIGRGVALGAQLSSFGRRFGLVKRSPTLPLLLVSIA
jgi:hypothetical protein